MAVLAQGTTKTYVTNCPTYGHWFSCFMRGIHKQMGEEVRSDYALSLQVLYKILGNLDAHWSEALVIPRQKEIVEIAFFLVLTFCLGLRGEEVVKIDIAGFTTYFDSGKVNPEHPHVMIPLQGHFKEETGERWHLLPIVWKTRLGIKVGVWAAGQMWDSLREQQHFHGFVFANNQGKQAKTVAYEPGFFEQLNFVRAQHPALFPHPEVNIKDDYGIKVGASGVINGGCKSGHAHKYY
jgi:hypothetical protein